MTSLSAELYRALTIRARALAEHLATVAGDVGGARPGLRNALRMVQAYPDAIVRVAELELDRCVDEDSRIAVVQQYNSHFRSRTEFIEEWFGGETNLRVPLSLIRAVETECEFLNIGEKEAVLAIGAASNFETYVPDLRDRLFGDIDPWPNLPEDIRDRKFAMMLLPRLEGSDPLWRPIVLGHEVAHLAVNEKGWLGHLDLGTIFEWSRARAVPPPANWESVAIDPAQALYTIYRQWARELLCDAYTFVRFGAAGVAALAEFLEVVGAIDRWSFKHPPGWLRIRLMTSWLGVTGTAVSECIAPWTALGQQEPGAARQPWITMLVEFLLHREHVYVDVASQAVVSSGRASYSTNAREACILTVATNLNRGLPAPAFCAGPHEEVITIEDEDVLNAGWIARASGTAYPVSALVAKSLSSSDFIREWVRCGGPPLEPRSPIEISAPTWPTGNLSKAAIVQRLEAQLELSVTIEPLLPGALSGTAVDVRLGPEFIVFKKTSTRSFDPLDPSRDARSMQEKVEKGWGEPFILHPDELVLAATLEYLSLPADLAAQVVTRSSYGRLGLITATAVHIHPHFKGCLTLELVNLGEIPIELIPGERIAQLVFYSAVPPADPPSEGEEKYHCATGPEFSRIRTDRETQVLRMMRQRFNLGHRRTGPPQVGRRAGDLGRNVT